MNNFRSTTPILDILISITNTQVAKKLVAKSSIALEIRTQKSLYRKELFANCVAKNFMENAWLLFQKFLLQKMGNLLYQKGNFMALAYAVYIKYDANWFYITDTSKLLPSKHQFVLSFYLQICYHFCIR